MFIGAVILVVVFGVLLFKSTLDPFDLKAQVAGSSCPASITRENPKPPLPPKCDSDTITITCDDDTANIPITAQDGDGNDVDGAFGNARGSSARTALNKAKDFAIDRACDFAKANSEMILKCDEDPPGLDDGCRKKTGGNNPTCVKPTRDDCAEVDSGYDPGQHVSKRYWAIAICEVSPEVTLKCEADPVVLTRRAEEKLMIWEMEHESHCQSLLPKVKDCTERYGMTCMTMEGPTITTEEVTRKKNVSGDTASPKYCSRCEMKMKCESMSSSSMTSTTTTSVTTTSSMP